MSGLLACQGESVAAPTVDSSAQVLSLPPARVISRDDHGWARQLVSPATGVAALPAGTTLEQAAKLHLERHGKQLGLNVRTLRGVVETGRSLRGGSRIVQLGQQVAGLPVFRARASVVMDAHNNLVSLSSHLVPDTAGPRALSFERSEEEAIVAAYRAVGQRELSVGAVHSAAHGGGHGFAHYELGTPVGAPRVLVAAVKRVAFPGDKGLRAAYQVELLLREPFGTENHAHGLIVDARDGQVVWTANLTASEAYTYRVWADPAGDHVPSDGPLVDASPYPGAKPDKQRPGPSAPITVSIEGFNTNPSGESDPWLSSGATSTLGNNVSAYSDRNAYYDRFGIPRRNGFDSGDVRADVTSANTFDRTYDLARAPDDDDDQIKAAVTQVFYVTNWLHDFWYDSGFDEESGNAQADNYGRGGDDGDPLLAEAQDAADSGAANNANMSTLSDGVSPRMQMYVWSGLPNRALVTEPAITFDDELGAASYGAQTFELNAELVLVDDGSTAVDRDSTGPGKVSDGCQAFDGVEGKIAVVDRGACAFLDKVENAQDAGAIAVLVLDNAPGHSAVNPSSDEAPDEIEIPLLALSYEDGQKVHAALAAGLTATRFFRGPETQRDGTIDNTVVAHEWGHYLHLRLVACASVSCGGMSEGWADFVALLMSIRSADTFPGQVYPLSQYASGGLNQSSAYFGIRRAPYSVDLDKNPFTFKHIREDAVLPTGAPLAPSGPEMNEVHNVGEIWAETLFEAYVKLLDAGREAGRPFEETRRRMADYVVAGMKAAPTNPTFVEQRDAILTSVLALAEDDPTREGDFTALAAGFAKRGLGLRAVAPPSRSTTLNEAVESFETIGELDLVDARVDDALRSCDDDGVLDAGEEGTLTLTIANRGWQTLPAGTQLTVALDDAHIELLDDATVEIGRLRPYGETTVAVRVRALQDDHGRGQLAVHLTSQNHPVAAHSVAAAYNYDELTELTVNDDAESDLEAWQYDRAEGAWTHAAEGGNRHWHAAAPATRSDDSLTSPVLQVSESEPFVISFDQRYAFEQGSGGEAYDGAVLEISQDGGASWQDAAQYTDPGYTGTLHQLTDDPEANALSAHRAWTGTSKAYPAFNHRIVDLGHHFAGQPIQLRFHLATDRGIATAGMDLDNLTFSGITNTPFHARVDDAGACVSR